MELQSPIVFYAANIQRSSGVLYIYLVDLFGFNSHLIQSRLKIDVTPIIAYTGYTPWWERATVAQSL